MKLIFNFIVLVFLTSNIYAWSYSDIKSKLYMSVNNFEVAANKNKGNSLNLQNYCASFEENDSIKGYFALISRSESQRFMYDIEITDLQSFCDLSQGVAYSIHTKWPSTTKEDGTIKKSAMGDKCSVSNIGGHYDPGLACSTYSQSYYDGKCEAIERIGPDYEYNCSADSIKDGNIVWCEAGDLSGKHGIIYPISVTSEVEEANENNEDNTDPEANNSGNNQNNPDNNPGNNQNNPENNQNNSNNPNNSENNGEQENSQENLEDGGANVRRRLNESNSVTRIYLKSPESYKDFQPFPHNDHYQEIGEDRMGEITSWASISFTCVSNKAPLLCASLDSTELGQCESGLKIIKSNYSSDDNANNSSKKYSWSDISSAVVITIMCCGMIALTFFIYNRYNAKKRYNNNYRSIEEQTFASDYTNFNSNA